MQDTLDRGRIGLCIHERRRSSTHSQNFVKAAAKSQSYLVLGFADTDARQIGNQWKASIIHTVSNLLYAWRFNDVFILLMVLLA